VKNFSDQTIVHHLENGLAITSTGRTVRLHAASGVRKVRLPFVIPRDFSLGIRILERLFRSDKCLAIPHAGSVIIIRAGVIYRWRESLEPIGNIRGDCPLHASAAVSSSGNLYFGEYYMNQERGTVSVIRVRPGCSAEAAHVFSAGSIRHIHGIYRDPFAPLRLWVTVGDEQGECYIYWTDDEFCSLHRMGDGSQWWRAVGLVFTKERVTWGTDSPHMPNHFVSFDRRDGKLIVGQPVDGTVWYAGTTSDGLHYASSSVEKGPGVRTNQARVWVSRDAETWIPACSFTKDRYPMPHFKWGTISFPSGTFTARDLWISGEALQGLDGVSTRVFP